MKPLKFFFLFVDIGFIVYWIITAFHLIPPQYLYNDYTNPILVNWNWSFFPLDLLVSITGFYSIYLHSKQKNDWRPMALISLVLTSASGLQAISYWTLSGDTDLSWWIPNLFLFIYPMFFVPQLVRKIAKSR